MIGDLTRIQLMEDSAGGLAGVTQQAQRNLGVLEDQLLTLRLSFGRLRSAVERAFAPLGAAVVPALNSAIRSLTGFADDAGAVMAALFGTVYKKTVTTAKSAGAAVRRSLADFDQLQRLNGGSGSGSGVSTVTLEPINDTLTPELQRIVDKINSLLEPVKRIDFSAAAAAFRTLGDAARSLGGTLLQSLERAWFQLLAPLAQWTVEAAVPASVDALSTAFLALKAALEPALAGLSSIRTALAPVCAFLGETVTGALTLLREQIAALGSAFSENSGKIQALFASLGDVITALWGRAEPILWTAREVLTGVLSVIVQQAAGAVGRVTELLTGLAQFVAGAFSGSWSRAWAGLKTVLKGAVNGIIGLINGLLSGVVAGINGIARGLNKFSLRIPDWVPAYGGNSIGFNISPITAPQIPYLAQGAVLPANKPFLAVVGDQRSGTNVEAPLSTIQEAVAQVMGHSGEAMLAGFQAVVDAIRDKNATLELDGREIWSACNAYNAKAAMMKGV